MGKRTPLHESHVALGARMVDFGGWDMPVHYGSQIDEHHAVRRDAGMFDVSHMTVVDLRGARTRPLLLELLANDVGKLTTSGSALYTCMLNERGGVIDDLITYFLTEDYFRLVVNAATRDKDLLLVEAPYAVTVLNGKNVTADPPRTQLWALLYAQVRQADDKDWRNVLLDDRLLRLRPRGRQSDLFSAKLLPLASTFENREVPVVGVTGWENAEIVQMLGALGLPADSNLSLLCVEMMPTMAALGGREGGTLSTLGDPSAALFGDLAGGAGATAASPRVRPLSQGLGHFRILRTSPLTEVPEICCASC